MTRANVSCVEADGRAGEQVYGDISRRLATVDRMIDCPGPAGRLRSFKPQINVTERACGAGPSGRPYNLQR